jgi:hypothetical protein
MKTVYSFLKSKIEEFKSLSKIVKIIVFIGLIIGFWVRFVGLFNLGYYFDMVETQYTWGTEAFKLGLFGFWRDYPMYKHYDYPQISLVYEYFLASINSFFGGGPQVFVALIKLVNWFFEIALFILIIYLPKEFKQIKPNTAYLIAVATYTFPSLWFVSGIWGQNDTLMVLVSLFTVYLLFKKHENFEIDSEKEENIEYKIWYKDLAFWSGVILATGFWIKQQPILIIPFVALYFLRGKTWFDALKILTWCLPFLVIIIFGSLIYTQEPQYFNFPILNFEFTNWQALIFLVMIILILPLILTFLSLNKKDIWQEIRYWFFGFWLITNIVSIPALLLNAPRYARVTLATAIRGDSLSNGASNFWSIFEGLNSSKDILFKIFSLEITPSQIIPLIYLILFLPLFFIFTKFQIKFPKEVIFSKIVNYKFSLNSFFILVWAHTSIYFFFFPNMHSRYLHFGIIYSFFILLFNFKSSFNKLQAFLVLLITIFNFSYFINQVLVFEAANKSLKWANDFVQTLYSSQINPGQINSIILFSSFILIYLYLLLNFRKFQKQA